MSSNYVYVVIIGQLKSLCDDQFYEYYTKNWHNCTQKWVAAYRSHLNNFDENTSNRAEQVHAKFKDCLTGKTKFSVCLKAMLEFLDYLKHKFTYNCFRDR